MVDAKNVEEVTTMKCMALNANLAKLDSTVQTEGVVLIVNAFRVPKVLIVLKKVRIIA